MKLRIFLKIFQAFMKNHLQSSGKNVDKVKSQMML